MTNELANKAFDLYVEMHRVSAADFMTAMEQNNVAGMKKANELLSMETMLLNIGVQHCSVKFQIPQHAESLWGILPMHGHTCVRCHQEVVMYCFVEKCGLNDLICSKCEQD